VEQELEDRLRRAPPPNSKAVAGSTPVPAFGDFRISRVATLGLNPSKAEFLARNGQLLVGKEARFVTLPEIGQPSLLDAPHETLVKVLDGTRNYFHNRPYRGWFDRLEKLLLAVDASYYAGSACHLDLAHWATDPVWKDLSLSTRGDLIEDGASFLHWQLTRFGIRHVLLNGRGVQRAVEKTLGLRFEPLEPIPGPLGRPADLYTAKLAGGPAFIGWSTNLQSSFGVTREFVDVLAQRLRGHVLV
jgi:hypothetical protein